MLFISFAFTLLIQIGLSSMIVKNSDVEMYEHKVDFPHKKESLVAKEAEPPRLELVIDVKNVSRGSDLLGSHQRKNRRGEKTRRRKDKHGKYNRQRNKAHKLLGFDPKQAVRNNEKANLVRNRTIEILKNGVRILSAGEDYSNSGINDNNNYYYNNNNNKSAPRVNETLLEKILSSAASKPDLLISASGIYKLPIGGDIYNSKKLSVPEENHIDAMGSNKTTEVEKTLTNATEAHEELIKKKSLDKKFNRPLDETTKDYDYDYEASDDAKENWNNNEYNKSVDNVSYAANMDYESFVFDYNIGITLEQIVSALQSLLESKKNCSSLFGDCPEGDSKYEVNNDESEDPCQKWLDCKESLESAFLGDNRHLPSCPCSYPSTIFYDDKIWDEKQTRYYRWRDASSEAERLDVYKPGATYCIRSLLTQGSSSLSSQHCCYDRELRLITRGSGAGTINFVSPDVSKRLHYTVDILPWRLCKGDFTRYNLARRPDNGNECPVNPNNERYQLQVKLSKHY